MKITVELEIDVDAYNERYCAGGPWSREHNIPDGLTTATAETVKANIVEALEESLYDFRKHDYTGVRITFKD